MSGEIKDKQELADIKDRTWITKENIIIDLDGDY